MSIATSLVALFAFVLLVLGVAASYLRRTSDIDGPVLQETIGIASGILMLAYLTGIQVLMVVVPADLLFSAGGVFLLALAVNSTSAYIGVKLARRYHPDWLPTATSIGTPQRETRTGPHAD